MSADMRIYFKNWLTKHVHLFPNPPFLRNKTEHGDIYGFTGITPHLSLKVSSHEFFVQFDYPGHWFEIVFELDCFSADCVASQNKKKLYYCELCPPEYRKYYPELMTLYEEHSFLPLVRWCQENFQLSKRLFVCFMSHSCAIIRPDWAKNFKKHSTGCSKILLVEPFLTQSFLE